MISVFGEKLEMKLKSELKSLQDEVIIKLNISPDKNPVYSNTILFLQSVCSLNENLKLLIQEFSAETYSKYPSITNCPNIRILSHSNRLKNLIFYGIPTGNELSTFIEALKIGDENETQSENIKTSFNSEIIELSSLELFVTPTCVKCPIISSQLVKIAYYYPLIKCSIINATLFTDWSNSLEFKSVPFLLINNRQKITEQSEIEKLLSSLKFNL